MSWLIFGLVKKNAYRCICLDKDNTKYEANIPKAKCELIMRLSLMKGKFTQTEMTKLAQLIEEYGNECYDKGVDDNQPEDESI